MRKTVFFIMLLATATVARAFDFSKPATTGQTLYYNVTSATTVTLVAPANNWAGYDSPAGRLTVPATVEHDGVTYTVAAVDNNAFKECGQLTAVELPGSVASIGYTAFFHCAALTSARLSEGTTAIGRMAFANCPMLDTIELPSTLRQIGVSAFNSTAYFNNTDNWLDSVLYIGSYVIQAGSLVTGPVTVVEGTIGLGTGAFEYCHNMRQAVLPSSLLFVGYLAFADCDMLDTLRVHATVPPTLADDAFLNSPTPTVVVPCGTLAAYSAAPYWSQLNLVEDTCIEGIAEIEPLDGVAVATVAGGIEVRGAQGATLAVCDMAGRTLFSTRNASATQRIALPANGIYVVLIDGRTPYKVVMSGLK